MIPTEQIEALRKMTTPAIRRAQRIVQAQLPLAYNRGNTTALVKLQEWEQTYIDELLRRQFERQGANL